MTAPNSANILAGVGPAALAYFAPADAAGPLGVVGTDGVQTVAITGTPTGGTFTLSWRGFTTAPIAFNAASTVVQAALRALPRGSTITVTGTAPSYTVTVPKDRPQIVMTANYSGLTGGTNPTVTVTNTTPGVQTTTMATALVPASFLCAGWVTQDGLVQNPNNSSTTITGYGTTQALRVLVTQASNAFDIGFLETNPLTTALHSRQPLSAVSADIQGHWAITRGPALATTYAGLFDVVDGASHVRIYAPRLQISDTKSRSFVPSGAVINAMTFTAVPDVNGIAVYEDYVVDALAAA
jgi:hypothetical protein